MSSEIRCAFYYKRLFYLFIQYFCLQVQAALAQSDSKHFLVLFRDKRTQYRGLYTWDQQGDSVQRIDGVGPRILNEEKYGSNVQVSLQAKKRLQLAY